MAKMMMGQITHARERIAQLKAQKLGDAPKVPSIKGGIDLLKELRRKEDPRTITPTQLKAAFGAFVLQLPRPQVEHDSGSYKNNYRGSYVIKDKEPSSIEDALATAIYDKENSAELNRYVLEKELYSLNKGILNLEASRVEDAIVLGDNKAALDALKAFAEFTL